MAVEGREGRVRSFLGPRGSSRRRRLRALPVAGPVFLRAIVLYRRFRVPRGHDLETRYGCTAADVTRKNTRHAYERVYGDDRLLAEYLAPERIDFYREVAEIAARLRPRSVIDVGCGAGNLLHELGTRAAVERLVGVDWANAGIRRARELLPSGEFHVASLYDLGLDESFDLVLCTEVLEHLLDPEAAVERLVDLCAESGSIVITVPDGAVDTWEGHRNFWTGSELEEFLARHGEVSVRSLQDDLLAVLRPQRQEPEPEYAG